MAEETTATRKCAKCRQMRPLSDFDARFLKKPVRLTCAACRREKAEHEAELHRIWLETSQVGQEITRRQQEERLQEERQREVERVCEELAALGFTRHEQFMIIGYTASRLRRHHTTWAEVRHLYVTLDPPYLKPHERRGRGMPKPPTREHIFAQQQGHCYYCGHELLPLAVWAERPEGSFASQMSRQMSRQMKRFARTSLPVLDHKTPLARGGDNALDNLAYACAECNQRKFIRTEAEFRAYPLDVITRLVVLPDTIEWLLAREDRCDWHPIMQSALRW